VTLQVIYPLKTRREPLGVYKNIIFWSTFAVVRSFLVLIEKKKEKKKKRKETAEMILLK